MLRRPTIEARSIALMSTSLLAVMLTLGATSEPPEVRIGELMSLEEGDEVSTRGILVDLWMADSGSETLVLVDLADNSTARIIWLPGSSDPPSGSISIGDEVGVRGELSSAQVPPVVFIQRGSYWFCRPSEATMTVLQLSEHWPLFQGDTLGMAGILRLDPSTGSYRLWDSDQQHSILLRCRDAQPTSLLDRSVSVTGALELDSRTMCLVLFADEILPRG